MNDGSKALGLLANAFTDYILGLSDEEVLAEFSDGHGDPAKNAADMRALFDTIHAAVDRIEEAARKRKE